MFNSEAVKALKEFGLTEYEAKALIGLARGNSHSASDLSEFSAVPRSKIYEALSKLEARGLLETQNGRPKKFRIVSFDMVIQKLKEERIKQLKEKYSREKIELEENYDKKMHSLSNSETIISQELKTQPTEDNKVKLSDEEAIWTLKGRENILEQIKKLIGQTSREIRIMLPIKEIFELKDSLKSISTDGIRPKIIVHEISDNIKELLKFCDVWHEKKAPLSCGLIIIDNEELIFVSELFETGFRTKSKSTLSMLSHFFDHEWKEANQLVYYF